MADRVLAALLAAGGARRFGGGKLDAPCAGRRLGDWALAALAGAGVADRIIVVPPSAPAFATESGWPLVTNADAATGLGTSLATAATHALDAGASSLLVLLADMPLVDASLLRSLLQAGAPAAVLHGARPGVPALLPAAALPRLSRLTGDRGAGHLLAQWPRITLVPATPAQLLDVDDPAALARAGRLLQAPR